MLTIIMIMTIITMTISTRNPTTAGITMANRITIIIASSFRSQIALRSITMRSPLSTETS